MRVAGLVNNASEVARQENCAWCQQRRGEMKRQSPPPPSLLCHIHVAISVGVDLHAEMGCQIVR